MTETDETRELRERPTGELVKELSRQVSSLVRKEIELAKVEATEKGKRAGIGAGMVGGATIAGVLALGAFTAFLILVLDLVLPTWAAALVVTALWALAAAVLAAVGRGKFEEAAPLKPEETIDSVREDAEWLKERTKSAGR
jgi:hypothetical protein